MVSPSSAVAGMMLLALPAWKRPTVTTAVSRGVISRATMDCSLSTIAAPMTTGSVVVSGREPCPPRP